MDHDGASGGPNLEGWVRALWITERFPPDRGGAAVSAGRQVAALAPRLTCLDVVRLAADLPPARVEFEERGRARLYRVGRAGTADESLQILFQTVLSLLGAHRYDLAHGFYAVPAGYVAATAARLAGIPCVVSLRGNDVDRGMFHGPRLPFLLWTLEHAGALLGVSREILSKARALTGREERLFLVPNSVDATVFAPAGGPGEAPPDFGDAPRPWIAFAGEARLKKGLPLLQDLADRLAYERRGTLFWIGGVRRDERLGIETWRRGAPDAARRVREVPYVENPVMLAALYRAMDLLVFPSLWEGMPNALLEAMACARPVLATAIGASVEVVEDGVTGFLLAPTRLDAFAAFTLALIDRGAAELARIGAAARARVLRDFTPEAERDAILGVYEGLVG